MPGIGSAKGNPGGAGGGARADRGVVLVHSFAEGVNLSSSGDAVTLTFFVIVADEPVAVQRIVLSESSLEPFALELGKLAAQRKKWD